MRKFILITVAIAGLGLPSFAQQSFGYGFLGGTFSGRGGVGGAFRFGIGGEGRIAPHFTAGGEVGGISKDGTGALGSGNVSFHVPVESSRVDPFFTGGVSLARKSGATGLWVNLGGGVNYWVREGIGARVEFRGYPGGYDLPSFSEFRIGVVFR